MPKFANNNPTYLISDQYATGSNLKARMQLHERFSTNSYGWHRWLFDQLDIAPRARILELGCGTGKLWQVNAYRIPAEWDITLSDFSAGMLETTKSELESSEKEFAWRVIEAENVPFSGGTFDAVIASHMLYHVADRPKSLSEIRRVLKVNGTLYATTNGNAHMKEIDELVEDPSFHDDTVANFGLENGMAQLEPFFDQIILTNYPDSLEVTDTESILQYLLSADGQKILSSDRLSRIRKTMDTEIANKGFFHITKASGLFCCRK